MNLYTLDEVIEATAGEAVAIDRATFGSVSIDSREIQRDALFVAIKGDRVDGHDYVAAALEAGAAAALVSASRAGELPQEKLIVVPDAFEGLRDLAVAARARSGAKIVAVTGSAGKTTTKEAIRTALRVSGPTHASIKSFNNHWGVPLMLARLPRRSHFGVFEIGMNHPNEIDPLSRLVRPHVAVVTTVAAAHLEAFESVEGIARAKAEIFSGVEPGGVAVLNVDHAYVEILIDEARKAGIERIVTYGFSERADFRIQSYEQEPWATLFTVDGPGMKRDFIVRVVGRHMAANVAAACAVTHEIGNRGRSITEAMEAFEAPEGRGLTAMLGPAEKPLLLIDQSYNANMASMAAAMDVFANQDSPVGEKVLVLGDMLEMGPQGPALHASLKHAVLATGATRIFLVGPVMASLAESLGKSAVSGHADDINDIQDAILASLAYGDAVMVKGSKGVRLAGLVKAIREKFA